MSDLKILNDCLLLNESNMFPIIIYCIYMANKCYVMLIKKCVAHLKE